MLSHTMIPGHQSEPQLEAPQLALSHSHGDLDGLENESEEDLSYEQMKHLLHRAEKRIRAATNPSSSNENLCLFEDPAISQNSEIIPQ